GAAPTAWQAGRRDGDGSRREGSRPQVRLAVRRGHHCVSCRRGCRAGPVGRGDRGAGAGNGRLRLHPRAGGARRGLRRGRPGALADRHRCLTRAGTAPGTDARRSRAGTSRTPPAAVVGRGPHRGTGAGGARQPRHAAVRPPRPPAESRGRPHHPVALGLAHRPGALGPGRLAGRLGAAPARRRRRPPVAAALVRRCRVGRGGRHGRPVHALPPARGAPLQPVRADARRPAPQLPAGARPGPGRGGRGGAGRRRVASYDRAQRLRLGDRGNAAGRRLRQPARRPAGGTGPVGRRARGGARPSPRRRRRHRPRGARRAARRRHPRPPPRQPDASSPCRHPRTCGPRRRCSGARAGGGRHPGGRSGPEHGQPGHRGPRRPGGARGHRRCGVVPPAAGAAGAPVPGRPDTAALASGVVRQSSHRPGTARSGRRLPASDGGSPV
ncbi:MAG: Peptidase, M48 family, partial [uncultured Nocardioidaceae bacterium]